MKGKRSVNNKTFPQIFIKNCENNYLLMLLSILYLMAKAKLFSKLSAPN